MIEINKSCYILIIWLNSEFENNKITNLTIYHSNVNEFLE